MPPDDCATNWTRGRYSTLCGSNGFSSGRRPRAPAGIVSLYRVAPVFRRRIYRFFEIGKQEVWAHVAVIVVCKRRDNRHRLFWIFFIVNRFFMPVFYIFRQTRVPRLLVAIITNSRNQSTNKYSTPTSCWRGAKNHYRSNAKVQS